MNDADRLPGLLDAYTTWALRGVVVGTVLCLGALLTNPVPDPSFPWFSLPQSIRVPVTQPRIEHWPVTYTLGIWLWIAGFPAVFLGCYRRFGDAVPGGRNTWLVVLPTVAMAAWTTYCRFFWPKLHPPTWNAPSYTLVCWGYCSTYDTMWSNLAYLVVLVGLVACSHAYLDRDQASPALGAFGLLAFPLGIPALLEAANRRSCSAPD